MRILFAGGGTAGHITPAISIAEFMKKEYPKTEIAFVGRNNGAENNAIIRDGYKLFTIDIQGFRRSVSSYNIKTALKLVKSFKAARDIINSFSPDIIIGTGGYVCYPILKIGHKMKIPCLIHESNAYPGIVTRIMGRKCNKVMLGMKEAEKYLTKCKSVETVGNPIRDKFTLLTKQKSRKEQGISENEIFIISFGGSIGAKKINDAVAEYMNEYAIKNPKIKHIHATGRADFERIKKLYPELCTKNGKCRILPYIDNMPELLSAADISITRSGAMTIAEIKASGCCPILIPSPNVTANHQLHNAKSLAKERYAIIIEEDDLEAKKISENIDRIIGERKRAASLYNNKFTYEAKKCKRTIANIIIEESKAQ